MLTSTTQCIRNAGIQLVSTDFHPSVGILNLGCAYKVAPMDLQTYLPALYAHFAKTDFMKSAMKLCGIATVPQLMKILGYVHIVHIFIHSMTEQQFEYMEKGGAKQEVEKECRQWYLVCQFCQMPVVGKEQIIRERYESIYKEVVYSYELDVLEDSAWCYR
ncbi:hypothetical protein Pmar_PMAR020330 [Perkinsus marinus ATCC 50983]|uniref:Uncharacterized protein n=1 Tax=Perkinsus marinus (strain ATCC 50983 / TXsc) TaxID=423536 RepID=C5KFE1_PERM5|nr:hypothetical protein Pmar_PMAR020330 [Perkinsus marinus ATCC 50983]EER16801.1 hypothetical protein Pmar_PMAR020330 [Perkinsus marinus ATCC 50983]|eukprot:XP_002785005.1 hypothetical protein Pmar_PMAR020330 [Perkinsus marinus ATCC 50983]